MLAKLSHLRYNRRIKTERKYIMSEKFNELKEQSGKNIEKLITVCNEVPTEQARKDINRYYMNKYGNHMAAKIFTVLFTEILIMITIMNTHIDSLWYGIPYADAIIYGCIWGAGGIYLLQMLIKVILRTYDLKVATDAGNIKMSTCRVLFDKYDTMDRVAKTCLYIKPNRKNEALWFYERKSKMIKGSQYNVESNIMITESSGTELTIYIVDDKRHDLFLMVKGRPIRETADKILKEMWTTRMYLTKARINYYKLLLSNKIKSNKK